MGENEQLLKNFQKKFFFRFWESNFGVIFDFFKVFEHFFDKFWLEMSYFHVSQKSVKIRKHFAPRSKKRQLRCTLKPIHQSTKQLQRTRLHKQFKLNVNQYLY